MRGFYEEPEKHPLQTPSGKIEICSQNLSRYFPDDKERPPVPHWIEKGDSHDERISGERAKKYPLLIISNHGRWRVHASVMISPGPRRLRPARSGVQMDITTSRSG
jgi:trimethylamine-N-oxide reductase (cytochrome c)